MNRTERIEAYKSEFKTSKWSIRALKRSLEKKETKGQIEFLWSLHNDLISISNKSKSLNKFIQEANFIRGKLFQEKEDLESNEVLSNKIPVLDLDLFFEIMILLKQKKCIKASYKEMSKFIYQNFYTRLKASTIENKIKPSRILQKYEIKKIGK